MVKWVNVTDGKWTKSPFEQRQRYENECHFAQL